MVSKEELTEIDLILKRLFNCFRLEFNGGVLRFITRDGLILTFMRRENYGLRDYYFSGVSKTESNPPDGLIAESMLEIEKKKEKARNEKRKI